MNRKTLEHFAQVLIENCRRNSYKWQNTSAHEVLSVPKQYYLVEFDSKSSKYCEESRVENAI